MYEYLTFLIPVNKMKIAVNMSNLDRILRILAGLFLIYLGFFIDELTGYILLDKIIGVIGIINIMASISGFCPLYKFAGISSCKKPE